MVRRTNKWTPLAECKLNEGEEYLIRERMGASQFITSGNYVARWRGPSLGFHSLTREICPDPIAELNVEVFYNNGGNPGG